MVAAASGADWRSSTTTGGTGVATRSAATVKSYSNWLASLQPFSSTRSSSHSTASSTPLEAITARKPSLCW